MLFAGSMNAPAQCLCLCQTAAPAAPRAAPRANPRDTNAQSRPIISSKPIRETVYKGVVLAFQKSDVHRTAPLSKVCSSGYSMRGFRSWLMLYIRSSCDMTCHHCQPYRRHFRQSSGVHLSQLEHAVGMTPVRDRPLSTRSFVSTYDHQRTGTCSKRTSFRGIIEKGIGV